MTHVNAAALIKPASTSRWAIMRKTAIGVIDICQYYDTLGAAYLAILDLPHGDYIIAIIDRKGVTE